MNQTLRTSLLLSLALLLLAAGSATAAILELSGPAGGVVSVNGRTRGFFPLEHPLDLGPGRYVVRCTLPGHKDYESVIVLDDESDWKRLHVRLTPYSRRTAAFSNVVLAGLGQHYLDKPVKGWLFNIAEGGGLLTALVAEANRVNYRNDFLLLKDRYDTAINPDDLAYFRTKSEQAYTDMQDMESLRNTGLLVAGGVVVLSVLDALLFFPSVEAGPGPGPIPGGQMGALDPALTGGAAEYYSTVHAGVRLAF